MFDTAIALMAGNQIIIFDGGQCSTGSTKRFRSNRCVR